MLVIRSMNLASGPPAAVPALDTLDRAVSASKTLLTVLPMTTWNWPPASTTVITPGAASTAALSALAWSLSWNRSRVAQCVTDLTFASPPTPVRIASARVSYLLAVAMIPPSEFHVGPQQGACLRQQKNPGRIRERTRRERMRTSPGFACRAVTIPSLWGNQLTSASDDKPQQWLLSRVVAVTRRTPATRPGSFGGDGRILVRRRPGARGCLADDEGQGEVAALDERGGVDGLAAVAAAYGVRGECGAGRIGQGEVVPVCVITGRQSAAQLTLIRRSMTSLPSSPDSRLGRSRPSTTSMVTWLWFRLPPPSGPWARCCRPVGSRPAGSGCGCRRALRTPARPSRLHSADRRSRPASRPRRRRR